MHRLARLVGLALVFALPFASQAQPSATGEKWAIYSGYTQSLTILGSEDQRRGAFYGIQFARREPRLRLRKKDAELVLDAHMVVHYGGDLHQFPSDVTAAAGVLAMARWTFAYEGGHGTFFELGWGLQYQSRETHDLNSRLNSTPVVGIGGYFPFMGTSVQITLRGMHISNAGTVRPNLGQNQVSLLIGVRF